MGLKINFTQRKLKEIRYKSFEIKIPKNKILRIKCWEGKSLKTNVWEHDLKKKRVKQSKKAILRRSPIEY